MGRRSDGPAWEERGRKRATKESRATAGKSLTGRGTRHLSALAEALLCQELVFFLKIILRTCRLPMCAPHACTTLASLERAVDLLQLELQTYELSCDCWG